MQTLYFIAMVAGVGWLMAWAAMPHPGRWGLWWPFDMKDDMKQGLPGGPAPQAPEATPPPRNGRALSWRDRAARRGTQRRDGLRPRGDAPGRRAAPARGKGSP
jgi:hypothetical protein